MIFCAGQDRTPTKTIDKELLMTNRTGMASLNDINQSINQSVGQSVSQSVKVFSV